MTTDTSTSAFCSDLSDEPIDSITAGFKEENVCGEGASCTVYRMHIDGLQVAVKRLKSQYRNQPTYVSSYRKEYQIGQRLKHDALPVYRDKKFGFDEVYIVMDYVDGISLAEFLKTEEGKTYFSSLENVKRFLSELLNVVAYLHRSGVIHCDLKPENIMLRHIDRGVMLLDLDKAYSDTLDQSHGGTLSISDPLSSDQKPTRYKDFSAIANIVDIIAKKAPKFPTKKLKAFRKECLNVDTDANILAASLNQKNPNKSLIVIGIIVFAVFLSLIIWKLQTPTTPPPLTVPSNDDTEVSTHENQVFKEEVPKDTISVVPTPKQPIKKQKSLPKTPEPMPQEADELDIDIDTPMANFITEIEAAQKILVSGWDEKRDYRILQDLTNSYLSTYRQIREEATAKYSDMNAVDVELAVAKAYEKSRAGKLFTKFNNDLRDTLRKRDPEFDAFFR